MEDTTQLLRLRVDNGFALVDADMFDELVKHRWFLDDGGYPSCNTWDPATKKAKSVRLHALICKAPKGMHVDHRDTNKRNNTRENFRPATARQTCMNQSVQTRPKSSQRFKGVSWRKDTQNWAAYIKHHGIKMSLGSFASEEEAARAYNAAAILHFGEFAKLNFLGAGVIRLSGVRSPCRQVL